MPVGKLTVTLLPRRVRPLRVLTFGIVCSLLALFIGASMGTAHASPERVNPMHVTARYALQSDIGLGDYPYTLKVRHCLTEDDWGAGTRLVRYDPTVSVVVIRCRKH